MDFDFPSKLYNDLFIGTAKPSSDTERYPCQSAGIGIFRKFPQNIVMTYSVHFDKIMKCIEILGSRNLPI